MANNDFSQGIDSWYTETQNLIEVVGGTSRSKALKMTRNQGNPRPFISQWITWPINQKFIIGMRYKAKLNSRKILLCCEGYTYIDIFYLYLNTLDTNGEWVIQESDTIYSEFIEDSG